MHITFALLGAAIASSWLPSWRLNPHTRIAPWAVLHAMAVLAGLAHGLLTWPALLALMAMAGLCLAAERLGGRGAGQACTIAAGALGLALALHALPGFHNPMLLDAVRTSVQARPFTLYANFDKASAGLWLLVFFAPRLRSFNEVRAILGPVLLGTIAASVLTLGIAWAAGQVRPDVKLPAFAAQFLLVNLLFTCVAEEAFFRGLIQERMGRALAGRPRLAWVPVLVSSLLFGLAHAGGGPATIALASIAGLVNALVYARTGRIEAAVLTHFLLNATHFLCFTYPAGS